MEIKEIEATLEALLFASGDPVSVDRLRTLLDMDETSCVSVLDRLSDRYSFERRGMRILKLENMYQMVSASEYASFVRRLLEERRPGALSKPALEVLAIVAYFQPTTRAYIDQIRGVDSSNTLASLIDKGLVRECGRLEVVGRPIQYATTAQFLRVFGLSALSELPELPFGEDEGQLSLLTLRTDEERPVEAGERASEAGEPPAEAEELTSQSEEQPPELSAQTSKTEESPEQR